MNSSPPSSSSPTQTFEIQLPEEVIAFIMGFLCLEDRISASLTCHHWYRASRLNKLHKNEVVAIYDNISRAIKYLAPETPGKSKILPTSPPFTSFLFQNVEVKSTGDMRNFWPMYGPTMKSLTLNSCEISEKTCGDILKSCPGLEKLYIIGCNELFMSGKILENMVQDHRMYYLTEIGLNHTRYISDSILNRFVTIAPILSKIVLDGCFISCSDAVYLRFYPEPKRMKINADIASGLIPLDVASNVLTLQNILNILSVRSESISSISLGHTSINTRGLKTLCSNFKNSKLKSIGLASCFQLVQGIDDLAQYFSDTLECLDLGSCVFVSKESLSCIPNLKSLTTLNLYYCSELTDEIINQFNNLINLKSLDISRIEKITGPAILEGLRKLEHLEHLYMNEVALLDSASLLILLQVLPPLKTLELSKCQSPMLDDAIKILCDRHTSLKRLNLAHCPMVSDVGLTGLQNVPSLPPNTPLTPTNNASNGRKISLASKAEQQIVFEEKRKKIIQENITPYKEQFLEEQLMGIAKLHLLKYLDLTSCPRVTDVSIKHAFKFKELKFLSLDKNTNLTDVSLQCLAVYCPSLQELLLQECRLITDEGINFLSHLHRLRKLTLSGCVQLTNASLEALMKTKSPIRDVEIRYCQKFSMDAVNIFSNWLNHSIIWSESVRDFSSPPLAPCFPTAGTSFC